MKHFHIRKSWPVLWLVFCLLFLNGCHKEDSGQSKSDGDSAGSGSASGETAGAAGSIVGKGNAEAVNALRDELDKRWLKTPEGLISEFPAKTYIATGERAGPESFYRQIRELRFDVNANELSDADKLNGIQFVGYCQFSYSPVRVYADPNAFGPPKWSDWHDSNEAVRVQKKNGKWTFSSLGYLVAGTKPSANILSQLK